MYYRNKSAYNCEGSWESYFLEGGLGRPEKSQCQKLGGLCVAGRAEADGGVWEARHCQVREGPRQEAGQGHKVVALPWLLPLCPSLAMCRGLLLRRAGN